MSHPPSVPRPDDDPELVPEDDAVIGRALRRSAVVLVVLVAAAAVTVWAARRPEPVSPETGLAASAPREVRIAATPPPMPFADVGAAAGIRFVHTSGGSGEKLLPETMGGGVAFLDFDNDDDQDLLFVNGASWPHAPQPRVRPTLFLYRNDGPFRFTDVTREAGLAVTLYGMGVAVGDVDGDGWRDVYVTAVGENRLFRNRGGRFEDATKAAGVAGRPDGWSTGAAFFDADGDTDLDLFLVDYVKWSKEIDFELDFRLDGVGRAFGPPQSYEGTFPTLFRNDGGFRFTDVSKQAGVQVTNPVTGVPEGKALTVLPIDFDRDGKMDVFVANDTVRKFFFHNRGAGVFVEEGEILGVAYDRNGNATGAMGVDAACYRNDDELGIAVGNFANEMSSLYVTQGDPSFFVDEAIGEGIGAPSRRMLTFGLFFFDADLDGRQDLLQANGHIEEAIARVDPSQSHRQPVQLFWNAGAQGFVEVPPATTGALATPLVGRGAAYADLDADGDLDVVLTQIGDRPLLARNDQSTGHHWVRLRLRDRPPNVDAIGARVELEAGGVTQTRWVMPTRSYLSQVELPVTFGLGTTEKIDAVRVVWPDGVVEEVGTVEVDRVTEVDRSRS